LVPVEMPWMGTRRSPLILFETPLPPNDRPHRTASSFGSWSGNA
jgi:hypothetical protein